MLLPFLSLHLNFYTLDLDKLERDVKTIYPYMSLRGHNS